MALPDGWFEVTALMRVGSKQVVVLGDPGASSHHDCDEMGCTSVSHVLARGYVDRVVREQDNVAAPSATEAVAMSTTKPVEGYEYRIRKYKSPCHVCPVCGKECGVRGGITQHMPQHIKSGEVTLVKIPREDYDYYVDLLDGRRFRI